MPPEHQCRQREENMDTDLSLIETPVLVEELLKRCDVGMVAFSRQRSQAAITEYLSVATAWKGGVLPCLGLVEVIRVKLVDTLGDAAHDP
jgi:hypothetical protein